MVKYSVIPTATSATPEAIVVGVRLNLSIILPLNGEGRYIATNVTLSAKKIDGYRQEN